MKLAVLLVFVCILVLEVESRRGGGGRGRGGGSRGGGGGGRRGGGGLGSLFSGRGKGGGLGGLFGGRGRGRGGGGLGLFGGWHHHDHHDHFDHHDYHHHYHHDIDDWPTSSYYDDNTVGSVGSTWGGGGLFERLRQNRQERLNRWRALFGGGLFGQQQPQQPQQYGPCDFKWQWLTQEWKWTCGEMEKPNLLQKLFGG